MLTTEYYLIFMYPVDYTARIGECSYLYMFRQGEYDNVCLLMWQVSFFEKVIVLLCRIVSRLHFINV